jgi:3-oxoadipate enol-lactonase
VTVFRRPPSPDDGPRTDRAPGAPRNRPPALPELATELLATPHGLRLEQLVTGAGTPTTVFAHGFAAGIAVTRPLGSAVAGRRVFFHFRGHGRSDAPAGPWTYDDLARDLRAVADLNGATRAVGVSLGAGALVALLAQSPRRFERVVFFLPAVVDRRRSPVARERLTGLLAAVAAGNTAAAADIVRSELPPAVRDTPSGCAYLQQRVDQLTRDGLGSALATLADQIAVDDRAALGATAARALVIGCRGDDLHPAEVAADLTAALPRADLHVYDEPGALWTRRADVRERISSFLNE